MIMVTMCVDTRMLFVGIMHVTTAGVRSVHILSFFYLCFLYYLVLLTQHQQVECHNRHACYQTIDSIMVIEEWCQDKIADDGSYRLGQSR